MRVGLVGVGRIGARHAAILAAHPEVSEVLVTDTAPEAAHALADSLGLTFVASSQVLVAERPDALVIASPTPTHAALVRAAITAGIPVFCEKPVAATLEGTIDLARLERETGAFVQVGFQRRFDPGYRRARELVRSGGLGRLHTIRGNTFDPEPPPAAYLRGSGGIFRDCSVHDFDILRFVTGSEAEWVLAAGSAHGDPVFAEVGDVSSATTLVALDVGAVATLSAARHNAAGYDVRMELAGESGTVCVGLDDATPLASAEEGVPWPAEAPHHLFLDRFATAYAAEIAGFIDLASQPGASSPCSLADALAATRLAEAATRSCQEERVVRLEEVPGA
ncbi:MAG: Gfo/Idh/MocA family oxidoreductase [Micrococcales bacterium]|nr:Gfo/Idh/MocA family oxidoreductase [Micrococcales bacterium]